MQYPLKLSFKIAALAPQLFVRDAAGTELLYVKQKLMSLKDKVTVFSDSGQTRHVNLRDKRSSNWGLTLR